MSQKEEREELEDVSTEVKYYHLINNLLKFSNYKIFIYIIMTKKSKRRNGSKKKTKQWKKSYRYKTINVKQAKRINSLAKQTLKNFNSHLKKLSSNLK